MSKKRDVGLKGEIYLGDNIELLIELIGKVKSGTFQGINVVYIDPPFYSKALYSATVKWEDKRLECTAYDDRWSLGLEAYLEQMALFLYLVKEVLADDGLIWIHLDWHVTSYVKIIADSIFGYDNFVNEIIWTYKSGGSTRRRFSRKHDNILVYSKSKDYKFIPQEEKSYNRGGKPYRFKGVEEFCDEKGWYTVVNMKDVWNIDMLGRTSSERTGYATQKPYKLLERIILSSSEEGDWCADFFSGSGAFGKVAAGLKRNFILCDREKLAVHTAEKTIIDEYDDYEISTSYDSIEHIEENVKESVKGNDNIDVSLKDCNKKGESVSYEVSLRGYVPRDYSCVKSEEFKEKIAGLSRVDGLSLIDFWSLGYLDEENVYTPLKAFKRKGDILTYTCEVHRIKDIWVCVNDIFGNKTFAKI